MITKEQNINEPIIEDMKTRGMPFMTRLNKNSSLSFGTNDDLKILMICTIEARTETLNEQLEWIDEIKKVIEAQADLDCDF
jgi:hypothetical protein